MRQWWTLWWPVIRHLTEVVGLVVLVVDIFRHAHWSVAIACFFALLNSLRTSLQDRRPPEHFRRTTSVKP